ncbi:MAG TPA: SHOCT domain-containing protein [Streptosporangiales bacterium]
MIAALTAPAAALAWGHGPWGPGHWGGGPWGGGPWFLIGPLFWIVAVVAVALITRRAGLWGPRRGRSSGWNWAGWSGSGWGGGASQDAPEQRPSAEDILADRFARGEIDEAEYQDRLSTLRASR